MGLSADTWWISGRPMVVPTPALNLASLLWKARHHRKVLSATHPAVARAMRPSADDVAAGYAVQEALLDPQLKLPQKHAGWKIGATNKAGQQRLGLTEPFRAPIWKSHFKTSKALTPQSHKPFSVEYGGIRGIEAEFMLTLSSDLAPRDTPYTTAEVAAAVASVAPSIEICAGRVVDAEFLPGGSLTVPLGLFLADFGGNGFVVSGPECVCDREVLESLVDAPVEVSVNGTVEATGSGADVMGGPLNALTWLANELSSAGLGMKSGMKIITGATAGLTPVVAGDVVAASFGGFRDLKLINEWQEDKRQASNESVCAHVEVDFK